MTGYFEVGDGGVHKGKWQGFVPRCVLPPVFEAAIEDESFVWCLLREVEPLVPRGEGDRAVVLDA